MTPKETRIIWDETIQETGRYGIPYLRLTIRKESVARVGVDSQCPGGISCVCCAWRAQAVYYRLEILVYGSLGLIAKVAYVVQFLWRHKLRLVAKVARIVYLLTFNPSRARKPRACIWIFVGLLITRHTAMYSMYGRRLHGGKLLRSHHAWVISHGFLLAASKT